MEDRLGNAVLLDNSTVYGAKEAYDGSPRRIEGGAVSGGYLTKTRALMDVLEAIVLYENLIVEPRQGDYDLWGDLARLQGSDGTEILLQRPVEDDEARSVLLSMAVDRLEEYLKSDDFRADAATFVQELRDSDIPDMYTQNYDLQSAIQRDFSFYLATEDRERLGQLSGYLLDVIRTQKDRYKAFLIHNYAAFAFGGFFYQAVAHAYSVSYLPHAWRSPLVNRDMTRRQLDFGKYAIGVAAGLRQELVTRLNAEFGRAVMQEDFPVIASYVIGQVSRRSELLGTAVEIRETTPARAFRQWIAEVQSALRDERDIPIVRAANNELKELAEDLRREFGVHEPSAKQEFTIKAQVPGGVVSGETRVGVEKSAPTWLRKILHRRTHFVFLRDVARKSASLPPFIERFDRMRVVEGSLGDNR